MALEHQVNHLAELLHDQPTVDGRMKAYWKECRKNAKFEFFCIGMCELGELGGELLAYHVPVEIMNERMNEVGLVGGLAFGGAYAVWHVLRDGRKKRKRASVVDAMLYAGANESSCVGSATGVEYAAGKLVVSPITRNPLYGRNLVVRVLGLPIAFGVGLLAMSGLTFRNQHEVARFVGAPGALEGIYGTLYRFRGKTQHSFECEYDGKTVKIQGGVSSVTIKQRKVPRSYRGQYPRSHHVMYEVRSPLVRHLPRQRDVIEDIVADVFSATGRTVERIENIFGH